MSREAARLTGCKNFSKARRIDAHTAEAEDWGVTLTTRREIPEYTEYIGYRAHDFIPVWNPERTGKNGADKDDGSPCDMLPFEPESSAELPFEKNYYIKTKVTVCWFVQRERMQELEEKECRIIWHLTRKNCCFSGKEKHGFPENKLAP